MMLIINMMICFKRCGREVQNERRNMRRAERSQKTEKKQSDEKLESSSSFRVN